ncbi:IPT/TIG domain-containing protein [Stigmatella aurantiaca]|uniref:IPT/TIG domain-containing protein n=1 Tax=Stigmatella aurantiaca TaxID=41 RepID=A0A1H7KS97_STIAU|nr:Ig-like domain-containing protein [Stigmatella aurantiaca]SEK89733.1 IPT/TIG domain-containing protein [Stigmatella aurantiaca]
MASHFLSFRWCLALGALVLGLASGCSSETTPPRPPPPSRDLPDVDRSTVEVDRATNVRADGQDEVTVTVTVLKSDGMPLPERQVTLQASGEGHTFLPPSGMTDEKGVMVSKLVSRVAGPKQVTAQVEASGKPVLLGRAPTVQFIVPSAPQISKLALQGTGLGGVAGSPIQPLEVQLQDEAGAVIRGATARVKVEVASGPSSALKGTVEVNAVDGVARFTELVIERTGEYSLRAKLNTLSVESPSFQVVPAAASVVELTGLPPDTAAGSAVGAQVLLRDAFDNVATNYTGTLRIVTSDSTAVIPADLVFSNTDQGSKAFAGLSLRRAGLQTVGVVDTANGALQGQVEIDVKPGEAARLTFVQAIGQHSVRAPLSPVQVALTDAYGNTAGASTQQVIVTLSPASGVLDGTATVAPVGGVATFTNLSIAQEGTYTLTAQALGLTEASSTSFTIVDDVAPATPVLTQGTTTASSFTVQWNAVGDDGLLGTATSQELRYSTAPIQTEADFLAATPVAVEAPKAPGTAEQALVNGLAVSTTYHVALKVTDNVGNAVRSASRAFSTSNPSVEKLAFTVQPANGTAGVALADVKVALQDAAGNTVGNATLAVTLGLAEDEPPFTPVTVNAVAGIATFPGLVLNKVGTYHFKASSGSLPEVQSEPFSIQPAAAARLDLVGLVGPVTSGVPGSVEVKAFDAFDNVATGFVGTVHFTSTDGQATLPPDYTFTPGDAGHKAFTNVVLRTVGAQTVTVQAASLQDELTVEVGSGAVEELVLEVPSAPVQAGSPFAVTVTLRDGSGNIATGYTGTVSFGSSDGQVTLPADYTFTAADAGKKTFSGLVLHTAGTQSVTVQDTGATGLTETKSLFVTEGPTASLMLSSPGTATAGASFSVTLSARDAFGNVVTGYTGSVSFSSDDAQAALPEAYTFTSGDAGQHVFSATLKTAGTKQVSVTDGAFNASATLTVGAGTPAKLVFSQQPAHGTVRASLAQVRVSLQDGSGNTLSVSEPAVTVALTGGNPASVLSGTKTVSPVEGVASFSGLSVDQEGTAFELEASAPGLPSVKSTAFQVQDDLSPAVAVLSGTADSASSVTLSWVAVGDDGTEGTASSYELRHAATDITTEAQFAAATLVSIPAPQAAGQPETATVTGLAPGAHFFALKVLDGAGNSSRSASVQVELAVPPVVQEGHVIISEFRALGEEFIELRNTTAADLDVHGYVFRNAANEEVNIRAKNDPNGTAGTPVIISAGGVLMGIPNPSGAIPTTVGFVYGAPGTAFGLADTGDKLELYAQVPSHLEDRVDFQSFVTNPNTPLTATAFVGFAGSSTQLDPSSLTAEANDTATNWCVSFYPAGSRAGRVQDTAGAANGSCKVAVINEVMLDAPAGEDGRTFVELAGPGGSVIGGAKILDIEGKGTGAGTLNADGDLAPGETDGEFVLPAGTRFPADGILLIADATTANITSVANFVNGVDVKARDIALERGGGDTIQLVSAQGTLLDVLGHDTAGATLTVATAFNGLPMYATQTALTPTPTIGTAAPTFARAPNSADTGNNREDFRADPSATPGLANDEVYFSVTGISPNNSAASAGRNGVTITGTDFSPGLRATFGSNPSVPCGPVSPTSATCDAVKNAFDVVARVSVKLSNPASVKTPEVTVVDGFTYTGSNNDASPTADPLEADFCNLQFPASISVQRNTQTPPIYGQLYEAGVTETPGDPGGILAEVGYGTSGTNPISHISWQFFPATYNTQVGNDDEFSGAFTAPQTLGTYSYTYRFSFDNGLHWTYCDTDGAGSNNGLVFDSTKLGVMTVTN